MRKIVGLVFVGLGVALIALAIALPSYVYPRIAKAPQEPNQLVEAQGQGVTVLLAQSVADGGIRVLQNQNVTVTRRVRGEVVANAPKAEGDNLFYRLAFSTVVAGQPKGLLTAYVEGGSFNGLTGLSNNCCGDYLRTTDADPAGQAIKHEGLQFKFPFDAQQKNYPFWDVNVKKAVTARYDGEETIKGLKTYRYVQPITDVVITQTDVPGSLLQLPEQATVKADRVYSTTRTLWVEPHSGAIIKGSEKVNQRLVFNGNEAPVIQGTITYTDKTVQANVDKYASSARGLWFVKTVGPLAGWILGVLLVLVGLALLLIRPKQNPGPRHEQTGEDAPAPSSKQTA